ncbi:hypothetical protein DFH06DRAFT_1141164 [Mycena polygramma]|nr:hypothetical protein DFH06DRAFT_1141164 [Mycena polygramma]
MSFLASLFPLPFLPTMVSRAASPEDEVYRRIFSGARCEEGLAQECKAEGVEEVILRARGHTLLTAAIAALGREDSLSFCWIPRRDEYTSTTFDIPSMTYTIPKTSLKHMGLTCDKDLAQGGDEESGSRDYQDHDRRIEALILKLLPAAHATAWLMVSAMPAAAIAYMLGTTRIKHATD